MRSSVAKSTFGPVRHLVWLSVAIGLFGVPLALAQPPALNPFAPVQRQTEESYPGYVEMSDGKVYFGDVSMTLDKRLEIYDPDLKRQREIPLRVVKQVEVKLIREWLEREWRFKELANNEKYYTGRSYPARVCEYTITLQDDRAITGPLAAVLYVQAPAVQSPGSSVGYRPEAKPDRLFLHKRDKGEMGDDLKSLVYVKSVKLGEEALEEGRRKAAAYRPAASSSKK